MAFNHSWREVERKVSELRSHTIDDIAISILDLEVTLEECGGKLADALERVEALEAERVV